MSSWHRGTFLINQGSSGATISVRGYRNHLFGIRFEGIGFRVTHLASGYTAGSAFYHRLRDAVAFCEIVTPFADWQAITPENVNTSDLGKRVAEASRKFERYKLTWDFDVLHFLAEAA